MKGLDTNVLVRYIVQDDPNQAALATRFIETECTRETPGFLSHIVLCELVWVLDSCYKQPKEKIIGVLEQLLRVASFSIESPQIVWQALTDYYSSSADFADHLLARVNLAVGCETTVTLDHMAGKFATFTLLQ